MNKTSIKCKKGFSLVEVILVVAIAVGILFVVISLRGGVGTLENIISQKLQSRQTLDQAFQILVTEIRSAGPASNGAYPIESATTSSFVFYSDIDKDGIFEKVRYFLTTSTLQRGVIKPVGNPLVYTTSSEALSSPFQNLVVTTSTDIFSYFDSAFTGVENPLAFPINIQNVRVVRVNMYVDVAPNKAPKPTHFSNTITIRNLRSN